MYLALFALDSKDFIYIFIVVINTNTNIFVVFIFKFANIVFEKN